MAGYPALALVRREPQCNGVIERFMRTLKEQYLWLHRFVDLAQAAREIAAFIERYNAEEDRRARRRLGLAGAPVERHPRRVAALVPVAAGVL